MTLPSQDPSGWAPCAHSDKARATLNGWLTDTVYPGHTSTDRKYSVKASENSALEHMLWTFGLHDEPLDRFASIQLHFAADMWVRVEAEIAFRDGTTTVIGTYGDTFTLALARTLERLREMAQALPPRVIG